jgi:hypothetical protein
VGYRIVFCEVMSDMMGAKSEPTNDSIKIER